MQTLRGHPQTVKIRKNQTYNCIISYGTPEVINKRSVMYTTQHDVQDKKKIKTPLQRWHTHSEVFSGLYDKSKRSKVDISRRKIIGSLKVIYCWKEH